MSLKALCDENISNATIAFLKKRGVAVVSLRRGAPDSEVALCAQKEKRILITFDSDFANILNYPPSRYHGILRLNVHPPTNARVTRALQAMFTHFKKQRDFKGKLIIAEPAGFRVWDEEP